MTKETLYTAIEEATAELLDLGRALSWNKIADNCKFILTEIIDGQHNFHVQRVLRKKENDKKVALPFSEIIPPLQNLYDDLYDINLHIYRAGKRLTIIDIRYYLKSSLNSTYRQKVSDTHPMLHCKVAQPPWLTDKNEKFDINWEYKQWLIDWKLFWRSRKLETKSR